MTDTKVAATEDDSLPIYAPLGRVDKGEEASVVDTRRCPSVAAGLTICEGEAL